MIDAIEAGIWISFFHSSTRFMQLGLEIKEPQKKKKQSNKHY